MKNKVTGPNEIFKAVVVKHSNIILVIQYILKIKSIKPKMKAILFTMYIRHNRETLRKDFKQTDQGC